MESAHGEQDALTDSPRKSVKLRDGCVRPRQAAPGTSRSGPLGQRRPGALLKALIVNLRPRG